MKYNNINIILGLLILMIFTNSCEKEKSISLNNISEFTNEKKVTILDYSSDVMEPFISKDEKYLFFNNLKGVDGKELYYAERVDDITFQFKGEIKGVNSEDVDGNPTMDNHNNFYFISTRNLDTDIKTIYSGVFDNGEVTGLHQINGTINIAKPF